MVQEVKTKGSGVLAYVFEAATSLRIKKIELHLSAAGGASENFTMTKDDNDGSEYNVVYLSQDMNAVADLVQTWGELDFNAGEKLNFAYANTNSRTWGLQIYFVS
jgi:hypothetical protein